MTDTKHTITERQQGGYGVNADLEKQRGWHSRYRYLGERDGLYAFTEDGGVTVELFAKRTDPPAHWHIIMDGVAYEFCRTAIKED